MTSLRRNHAYVALWLAWFVPLAIYLFSAYRDVGYWDVGEMDTVPWILGIPHPTGFPAFVILGWLFTHLLPIGTVAYRMSVLSLVAMSVAAWLVARIVTDEYKAPWIGMLCAWLFALGDVTWARATRAEVHAVALCWIAATIYCALRFYRTRDRRFLFAGAGFWALGIATHPVAALIAPGLVFLLIVMLVTERSARAAFDVLGGMAMSACIVAACYAYLPLRSTYVTAHRLDPTLALGVPPGSAFWDYDHPASLPGFRALTTGSDFDVGGGLHAIVTPEVYVRDGMRYASTFVREFTIFGAALAALGVLAALARDPQSDARPTAVPAIAMLLCGFSCIPFALGYSDEGDSERYFLTAFFIAAIFIGSGAVWFARQWRLARTVAPIALIAMTAWLLYAGWDFFDQPNDRRALAVISNVMSYTPDNAIVIASWANATPIAYAAYVDRDMGQRTLVAAWIDDELDYIPKWTTSRPVYAVGTADVAIPGYHYEAVANQPPIYHIVKNVGGKGRKR